MQSSGLFNMLTNIGFKEIELAFPSAYKDDFDFVRSLIANNHIPEDARISVLTQARNCLIEKSIESLKSVINSDNICIK